MKLKEHEGLMNYQALVETSTREKDNKVNATRYCQAFGKEFSEFQRLPSTAILLNTIEQTYNLGKSQVLEVKRGKGGGAWVHPLVAIELAGWLSPDFKIHVLDTYRRYVEADITLADEIIQRQKDPAALAWIKDRLDGKQARQEFTEELAKRGVKPVGFGWNTNAVYLGLFGETAAGLKESRMVKNPRDGMSRTELRALAFAESLAIDIMDKKQAKGNKQTSKCSAQAVNRVGRALEG